MYNLLLCVCVLCMGLEKEIVHFYFFLALLHIASLLTDSGLIYTSLCAISVGSCCCLLILSFTYNRHVLFTNRIQNSRRFIMLLLCVLTNAAGCKLWLPQCRLLPVLEHTACPPTGGTHLQRKKSDFSVVNFNLVKLKNKPTVENTLQIICTAMPILTNMLLRAVLKCNMVTYELNEG